MNLNNIILLVVVAVAFAWLWRTGQLQRFREYYEETKVELRKCTWPTWTELKGSTVAVIVSILLLGAFTIAVDVVFHFVLRRIT